MKYKLKITECNFCADNQKITPVNLWRRFTQEESTNHYPINVYKEEVIVSPTGDGITVHLREEAERFLVPTVDVYNRCMCWGF